MSNFREGSTLELALCILKDKSQLLSKVMITVFFEFSLNEISRIFVGNTISGILYLDSMFPNERFKELLKL